MMRGAVGILLVLAACGDDSSDVASRRCTPPGTIEGDAVLADGQHLVFVFPPGTTAPGTETVFFGQPGTLLQQHAEVDASKSGARAEFTAEGHQYVAEFWTGLPPSLEIDNARATLTYVQQPGAGLSFVCF